MARGHYDLPPLTALAAFEAAARHGSLKAAARELNVTPGAISHQIKALETELGTPLFERRPRGVELTADGAGLFIALETAFSGVAARLRQIQDAHRWPTVTIGASTSVSALWLTPRLVRFWKTHGDIRVNQIVTDQPFTAYNRPDLVLHYGDPPTLGLDARVLFRDVLVPMASPALAPSLANPALADLARTRLIHLDPVHVSWTTWAQWFAALGYTGPIDPGIRVNNYSIALQTARDGVGVVLGWRRLAGPILESGDLVQVSDYRLEAADQFHIVAKPDGLLSDGARLLRDWLLASIDDGSIANPAAE